MDEERNIYIVSKYLPIDYLLITKAKKKVHFTIELGKPHLNQVIKFNLSNIGTNWHHMPPNMIQGANNTVLLTWYSWQKCMLWIWKRRNSNKLKLKNILQNNWPLFFKNINAMKDNKRLRNCSRLKEILDHGG